MRTLRRLVGLVLFTISMLVVAFAATALLRPVWLQEFFLAARQAYVASKPPRAAAPGEQGPAPADVPSVRHELGQPIGVLEIPRLGLSSVVIEGDETAALLLGVGHLADTPLPWKTGNSVLAAHRDTFFRPLAGIRRYDRIRFSTDQGELEYVVDGTRIVSPTDVDVLKPTSTSRLTLITCYPFDYIGPAPMRFVVTAERVNSSSESS